jgi:hypothetical protein
MAKPYHGGAKKRQPHPQPFSLGSDHNQDQIGRLTSADISARNAFRTAPPEQRPGVAFPEAIMAEAIGHVLNAVDRWSPQRDRFPAAEFEALLIADAVAAARPTLERLLRADMADVVAEGITRSLIARMEPRPTTSVASATAGRQ